MFFDSDKVPDEVIFPDDSTVNLLCTEASLNDSKSGRGQLLKLNFMVIESNGEVNIQEFLNIFHENKVAERIGQQRLKAYCAAIGKPQLAHNSDLLRTQCRAKLGIEVYDGRKRNIIKEFFPVERTYVGTNIQKNDAPQRPEITPGQVHHAPQTSTPVASLDDVPF